VTINVNSIRFRVRRRLDRIERLKIVYINQVSSFPEEIHGMVVGYHRREAPVVSIKCAQEKRSL